MPNWELKSCCKHNQVVFLVTIGVFTVVIPAVCFVFVLLFLLGLGFVWFPRKENGK
jgi:hypothetical protein